MPCRAASASVAFTGGREYEVLAGFCGLRVVVDERRVRVRFGSASYAGS